MTNKKKLKQKAHDRAERNNMSYSSALEVEKSKNANSEISCEALVYDKFRTFVDKAVIPCSYLGEDYHENNKIISLEYNGITKNYILDRIQPLRNNKIVYRVIPKISPVEIGGNTYYPYEYLQENIVSIQYWSIRSGKFVDKKTGEESYPPSNGEYNFQGTSNQWNDTLSESILDLIFTLPETVMNSNNLGLIPRHLINCQLYVSCFLERMLEKCSLYSISTKEDKSDPFRVGSFGGRAIDVYRTSNIGNNEAFVVNGRGYVGKINVLDIDTDF